MLYDSPSPAINPTARVPATSSTAHSQRRQSHNAPYASPFQNPRVRHSITGSSTPVSSNSSPGYHPPGFAHHVARAQRRTSSFPAPTDLTQAGSSSRPPVPLFGTAAAMDADLALADGHVFAPPPQGSTSPSFDSTSLTPPPDHFLSDEQIAQLQHPSRDFAPFDHTFDASSDDMFLSPSAPQTVSPQELTLDASNPPSSALTNMSTPGMDYEHSPFVRNDSALLTPASGSFLDATLDGADGMYSLFPEEHPFVDHDHVAVAESMSRTISGTSDEPTASYPASHATINGVKSRSRSKPLPAIETTTNDDSVTAKRKRNTLAARKSREKKQSILSGLEGEVNDLKALVAQWKHKADVAERRARDAEAQLSLFRA